MGGGAPAAAAEEGCAAAAAAAPSSPPRHVDTVPRRSSVVLPPLLRIDPHALSEVFTYFGVQEVSKMRGVSRLVCRLCEQDFVMREVLLTEVGRSEEALYEAFLEFGVPCSPVAIEGDPDEEGGPPRAARGRAVPARYAACPLPRLSWGRWVELCRIHSRGTALAPALGVPPHGGVVEAPQEVDAANTVQPCMGMLSIELSGDGRFLLFGGGEYDRHDHLTQYKQCVLLERGQLRKLSVRAQKSFRAIYGSGACRISRDEVIMVGGGTYHHCVNDISLMRLLRESDDPDAAVTDVEMRVVWQPTPGCRMAGDPGVPANAMQLPGGALAPCERFGHTLAYYHGKCILFGGRRDHTHFNDVWVLDPHTLEWTEMPCGGDIPSARKWHKTLVVGDQMLLIGGSCWFPRFDGSGWPRDRRGAHALDLKTWQWRRLPGTGSPALPPPLMQQGLTRVGRHVIVTGGYCPDNQSYDNGIWAYDILRDAWHRIGQLARERASHVQVVTPGPATPDCRALSWRVAVFAGGMYLYRNLYSDGEIITAREGRQEGGAEGAAAAAPARRESLRSGFLGLARGFLAQKKSGGDD